MTVMDQRVLMVFLWLWSSVAPDDVRLVGGASHCAGILERRDGGDWRAVNVSLSEWNLTSAETVCRQLDCGSVLSFRPPENSSRTEPPPDSRNLQITCSDPDDEVRLVGGSSSCSGRLEWKHHGEWRPVDPYYSDWTLKATAVICRRLDCGSAVSSRQIEESSDRFVWEISSDWVQTKSSLKECVTKEDRSTKYGLKITCSDSVRLKNETGLCSGRLEVKSDQHWSPVCEEDLDLQGAQVVCRELGCGAPLGLQGTMFGGVEAPFRTKKFQCEGHESTLLDCPNSGLTGNTCPPSTAVGLTCSDPDEVRLMGGSSSCSGRLDWKHHRVWRPVDPSYSSWNLKNTDVICRRLDFGSAVSSRQIETFYETSVWRIKSECVQFKSTLKECVRIDDLSNKSGLEITCSDSVRLKNETGLCSGRLEVKSDQHWSPVCEEDFDLQGAQVVCRELGCGAPLDIQGTMFGGVEAPFWTRDFQCKGNESTLLDCGGSGSARNNCTSGRPVGLSCADTDYIRLMGEPSRCAGTLEVKHMEEWRPLAQWRPSVERRPSVELGSDWDQSSAAVVCKMLKCGSAVSTRGVEHNDYRPVWGIRTSCVQKASSLLQCLVPVPYPINRGLEVICSDLLVKPNISFSFSTDGVSEATPQGYQALIGTSFNITCSIGPQYEGGDFQLIFSDSNTTQSHNLTAVNHSAHFLFPPSDQSHGGQYSCVYHLHVFSHHFSSESQTLSLAVGGLLVKPNISFSFSSDGVSEATPQGYQALIGTSFNITCSIGPQYEGGDFQLVFSDSNTKRSYNLTAVNHSAHFLFPPADKSHVGQYSCVYHLHVFSHHFSSESQTLSLAVGVPLRDLIIRGVVLLGGLLLYNIALYCYYKVKTKQQPPVLNNEDHVIMEIIAIPQEST